MFPEIPAHLSVPRHDLNRLNGFPRNRTPSSSNSLLVPEVLTVSLHRTAAVLASTLASNGARQSHRSRPKPYVYCSGGVAERSNAAVSQIFASRFPRNRECHPTNSRLCCCCSISTSAARPSVEDLFRVALRLKKARVCLARRLIGWSKIQRRQAVRGPR